MTLTSTTSAPRLRITTPRRLIIGIAALGLGVSACGGSGHPAAAKPASSSSTSTTTTAPTPTADQAALVAARPFTVQVPAANTPTSPAPLLVLLHGYGASGAIQSTYLKLSPAAEKNGMLYVYLDGTKNAQDKRFWNATDACCDAGTPKVDDSAYIDAVIASVKAQHNVDPKRVFLIGHSNGAFMSFRMACDHADEIAAIVSLEGATWLDPSRCHPSEPVSILAVHGTGDRTIKYDGGNTGVGEYPSAAQTVKTWASYDGCSAKSDAGAPATHAIVKDLPPATVLAYSTGCKGSGHVELWTQPDGVHIPQWTDDFADQMVDFLLGHPKQ